MIVLIKMRVKRETLRSLENYLYPEIINTKFWTPATLEQLLKFFENIEFSELQTVKATFGDEIHLFIEDVWAYSVIRHGEIFYIKKVGLPYEEWLAYVSVRSYPIIFAPWAIVINIWKYWVKRYGLVRALAQIIIPIIIWWISGIIPTMIFKPSLLTSNYALAFLLPLVIGVAMGFLIGSYQGFLISIAFFISMLYITWRLLIYQKKKEVIIKDPL